VGNLRSKRISQLVGDLRNKVTTLWVSRLWDCKIPTSREEVGMTFLGLDDEFKMAEQLHQESNTLKVLN
ncbi:hypothetical protein CCACVL1_29821, partial [Corchorus capsularis]